MKEVLNSLFEHRSLTKDAAKAVLTRIATGECNPSQVASFLSVYLMRPVSVEEMSGFREAMLELCIPFDTGITTLDIVGTGGDGKNTFNISTLSCLVAAGAGIRVTKHGNYGVSSVSGSSNVLEKCGVKFTNDAGLLKKQLENAGICFLHAPLFHPAMKNVAPVRKDLGVRTFFNLLGPLVNPCRPSFMLLGVYHPEIMRLYNYMLQEEGIEFCIVHSLDGYDEISLTGPLRTCSVEGEGIYELSGLPFERVTLDSISGGRDQDEAAAIFMKILSGKGSREQNDVVIVNAGFAIRCARKELSLEDCFAMARESLVSGSAKNVLEKLLMYSPR